MNNGSGWVKYLRLTDLEQIAAARAFGRRRDNADQLKRILATFEKIDSNPDYAAINGKASFTRVLAILRSEASAGS
jgi:hypothetical protein